MRLITHNGTFHADDVMAYAILIRAFDDVALVRTRDAEIINGRGMNDIVFDVGGAYQHEARIYDHHMKDGPTREDGIPYSSVGLIWHHYGRQYLKRHFMPNADEAFLDQVWRDVDRSLIREIDRLDNGVGTSSGADFAAFIDDFNPTWDALSSDPDTAFREAAAFAGHMLEKRVWTANARVLAFEETVEAARTADDARIVVLPASMPWQQGIFEGGFDEALYVVYPTREGSGWNCAAVPPEPGSFAQRHPLPEEWAGLRDAELAAVTGVADAIFCHHARFVCGAGSLKGIMAMAKAAVDAVPTARPR